MAQRVAALAFWEVEAHRLMPLTLQRIAAQPAALRTLLLGGDAESGGSSARSSLSCRSV